MLIVCFIAFAALVAAWMVLPHSSETVSVQEPVGYGVDLGSREAVSA